MRTKTAISLIICLLLFSGTSKAQTPALDTLLASQYFQKATTLQDSAQYDSSIVYFKKAGILYKKAEVWDKYVHAYNGIGANYTLLSGYDSAENYLDEALAMGLRYLGEQHPNIAKCYYNIGEWHLYKGENDQGLFYTEKALKVQLSIFGEWHPEVAASYNNIGYCYGQKGGYDQKLLYYQKALHIELKTLGENHPDVATSYNNIGYCYGQKGEYDQQLLYYQKALHIRLKTLGENHPDVATCYNNIGWCYGEKGRYDQQLLYVQKALDIRLKTLGENHPDVALSYNNIGYCYGKKGEYDQQLLYLQKALDIRLKTLGENHPDVALSYNNIGGYYEQKGEYDQQLLYLQKALHIRLKTLEENHPDVALSYNNIGWCYGQKGEYDQQLWYTQKALDIRLKTLGENHPHVAQSYTSIGECYGQKGEYDQQLLYVQKALDIRLKTIGENHPDVASSYNNIGVCYGQKGEYDQQLWYYQKALDIRLKILGKNHPHVAQSYSNIGLCYGDKGEYDQFLFYAQKALDIWLKTLGENHPDVATSYNNIGGCYGEKGEYDQQLLYYQKALDIRLKILGENHPLMALSYHNIGASYGEKGDQDQSLLYLQKALDIWLKILGENHPDVAVSYRNLGHHYRKKKNWDKTFENYQQALTALSKDFNQRNIYTNPPLKNTNPKPRLLETLQTKASALSQYYHQETQNLKDLQFALETYRLAADLIDTLRQEYTAPKTKQDLTANSIKVYEGGVQTAYQLHQITRDAGYLQEAFSLAEKSRAFLLQEALQETHARQFAGIPAPLLEKERSLKRSLSFYEKKRFEAEYAKDTARLTMYQNYLFERRQQFDSLIQALETNYPQYYALKYAPTAATIADVQAMLPDTTTAFVEYFIGDSTSYAFVITQNNFQVVELPSDSALEASVNTLRESIVKNTDNPDAYTTSYIQTAYKLWQQWVQPLEPFLPKTTPEGSAPRLIITPSGSLHYLPFEVLLTQAINSTQVDYMQLPYLIHDYTISYTASASLWLKSHQEEQPQAPVNCLAFAPQYSGGNSDIRSAGPLNLLRDSPLKNLPGALQEVQALANYTTGNFFIGEEATEANFKTYAPQAGIIHLAMHGLVDTEYPENSRLVFTHSKDTLQDDSLFVYELYNMQLPSQLVVLSACNTGVGQLAKGEGLLSMARAFQYAGSPNLATTLWIAEDNSTAKIMEYFYAGLARGLSKDVALREAKLKLMKSEPFPFRWAHIIPIGNMEPVNLKKEKYWSWVLALLGAVAVGSFVIWQFRKRKYVINDQFEV